MVKKIRKSVAMNGRWSMITTDKIRSECDKIDEEVEDIEPKKVSTFGDPIVKIY